MDITEKIAENHPGAGFKVQGDYPNVTLESWSHPVDPEPSSNVVAAYAAESRKHYLLEGEDSHTIRGQVQGRICSVYGARSLGEEAITRIRLASHSSLAPTLVAKDEEARKLGYRYCELKAAISALDPANTSHRSLLAGLDVTQNSLWGSSFSLPTGWPTWTVSSEDEAEWGR